MGKKYRIVIDIREFQQKILDYINSVELDKMISQTVLVDNPECKSAIIHEMAIASMITSQCELIGIKDNDTE